MPRSWLIVALVLLYVLNLGSVGFLGPDEPRYASIGREMARSGDWITPRLNGSPWFEKPPLLYWMTALATRAGLSDEWAARLPVALASVAFLVFFFLTLQREFSERIALTATAILATSAGWLACSFAAITDLPMAAALGAAMLVALFDTRPRRGYVAGALLGLAILAKAFVPVVLFAPVWVIARGKRLPILVAALVVAAPWFVLCWLRNGSVFWNEFFWKQQVERFSSPSFHPQPFWYYLPILLLGLFPWTPLAALLAQRKAYQDVRVRFLGVWLVLALLFFSMARNGLPAYVLPLMPALAIMLAVALDKSRGQAWWIAACVALMIFISTVAGALPEALLGSVRNAPFKLGWAGLPFAAFAGVAWWIAAKKAQMGLAMLAGGLAVGAGVDYLKLRTLPVLEERVSARAFWQAHQAEMDNACLDPGVSRNWEYGLEYYAGHAVPRCGAGLSLQRRLQPPVRRGD